MHIIILPEWANLTNSQVAAKLGCTPTAVLYARRRAAGLCERCQTNRVSGKLILECYNLTVQPGQSIVEVEQALLQESQDLSGQAEQCGAGA
jgi:hypothetical protein